MDDLNQLRDTLDMPQVQHDTTNYQLPLIAPTPMSPLPSDPRVEQPTVLHMPTDNAATYLGKLGDIHSRVDRGEITAEEGNKLLQQEQALWKASNPTPAEQDKVGRFSLVGRLKPAQVKTPVVTAKPEQATPEVQALHEIFGIAEPQPPQAPEQQQTQAVAAAEQTRHIVNSNVTTIATLDRR